MCPTLDFHSLLFIVFAFSALHVHFFQILVIQESLVLLFWCCFGNKNKSCKISSFAILKLNTSNRNSITYRVLYKDAYAWNVTISICKQKRHHVTQQVENSGTHEPTPDRSEHVFLRLVHQVIYWPVFQMLPPGTISKNYFPDLPLTRIRLPVW